MARVEFNFPTKNIRKNAGLGLIKRPEDRLSWLAAARKAIPDIPQIGGVDDWEIFSYQADFSFVNFTLKNGKDEKCYIVIDRSKSAIIAI